MPRARSRGKEGEAINNRSARHDIACATHGSDAALMLHQLRLQMTLSLHVALHGLYLFREGQVQFRLALDVAFFTRPEVRMSG